MCYLFCSSKKRTIKIAWKTCLTIRLPRLQLRQVTPRRIATAFHELILELLPLYEGLW